MSVLMHPEGYDRLATDRLGLAWVLNGRQIIELTAECATIKDGKATIEYHRMFPVSAAETN
jgi:hypothetical protein